MDSSLAAFVMRAVRSAENNAHPVQEKSTVENVYEGALQAFESCDVELCGRLNAEKAIEAAHTLCQELGAPYESTENLEHTLTNATATEGTLTFHEWLELLPNTFPEPVEDEIKYHLEEAGRGVRCVCGAWMQRMMSDECYASSSTISCDFSGDSLGAGEEVWHCPRNKVPNSMRSEHASAKGSQYASPGL